MLNSFILIPIKLIFSIILTIVSNKLIFLKSNKKLIICGVWVYFILSIVSPILLRIVGCYGLIGLIISLLRYIGLIFIIIGIIKSLVKIQHTKENKNDNIKNILD